MDFADAVFDLVISFTALTETSCEKQNRYVRKWATILFCMTLAARVLGGVFGVFYEYIDESERLVTYFLVELTIFCIEDYASSVYLYVNREWTLLETINLVLTFACALTFFLSTLNYYDVIIERLPHSAPFFLVSIVATGLLGLSNVSYLVFVRLNSYGLIEEEVVEYEFVFSIIYGILVVWQLCVLSYWCRSLVQKTGQPPRETGDPASEESPV